MTQPKQFRKTAPVMVMHSRKLRKELTEPEKRLWYRLNLRQLGGYKFRRQHPVGHYIADLACIERKLIIELDGESHLSQSNYDRERDAFLEKQGYRILRFWNNDVMENTEGILTVILEYLEK